VTIEEGLNCFIVARYANRPVAEVFHGTLPHFTAHLIAIAVLVALLSIVAAVAYGELRRRSAAGAARLADRRRSKRRQSE
jgi:hypothetical protein